MTDCISKNRQVFKKCNHLTMTHPTVTKSVSDIKKLLKKETVVSDLMWFLIWYAHPGDGRGHVAMNIQQLPSITLGTLRKLYTALWAKQTDHCWSHYRFLWLNHYSAADEQTDRRGPAVAETRERIGLLNQKPDGEGSSFRGLWSVFRHGKAICFVFIPFSFSTARAFCVN